MDRILPGMDKEISQNLKMILKKRGVDVHTKAAVTRVEKMEQGGWLCYYKEGSIQHMGGRSEIHAVIPYPASVPTQYPGQTAAVCTVHIIRKKLLPFFPFLRLRQIFSPAFPFLLIIRKLILL